MGSSISTVALSELLLEANSVFHPKKTYFCHPFKGNYFITLKKLSDMGRGDKRTTKGKIWRGSHGKTRNKKTNSVAQPKKEVKKNG